MESQYIDYEKTRCFSDAVIRYIQNDKSLNPFYKELANLEGFKNLLQQKQNNSNRILLQNTLLKQYAHIQTSSLVNQHIEDLSNENTFTVTTGHQLNIFTGPLYFIFKIVTVINLAKELKKEFPDKNFVPVYWMATEDHDFEEINHTYIGGKKVKWAHAAAGATGRLSTKTMLETLKEYQAILGLGHHADALAKMMEKAYNGFENLADASRYLVNELFGKYGLLILDADDKALKTEFATVMKQDIVQQNSFKYISESNQKLENIGIHPQVNPREINFFYLKEELRERIIFEDNKYRINHTAIEFSKEELLEEIDKYPERFSPNVVMRPLYQEIILPNIAYIGGGAEIVYWLQLKANFDFYHVDFPILLLRNSAMLADDKITEKLQKLDLSYQDLFKDFDTLSKKWIQQKSSHELSLKKEWQEIVPIFEQLKSRVQKIDITLAPSTEAVKVRLEKAMKSLEKKLVKAEKRNYEEALSALKKIKESLFPARGLQERKENFGLFYVKYGDDFIDTLIKNFKPLDLKFTIIINGVPSI